MKHASPNEIKTILEEMTLKRVIFRRPLGQAGVIIEMLANESEEIMVSEQGTPDPVLFPSTEVVNFFSGLDLFSTKYKQTIVDARKYCPPGFDFLRKKPEMTLAEFLTHYEQKAQNEQKTQKGVEPVAPQNIVEQVEDKKEKEENIKERMRYFEEQNKEGKLSEYEKAVLEDYQRRQTFVGKYLTARNLMRVTGALVLLELILTLFFPPLAPVMKNVIYICAGLNMAVAVWVMVYENSNPDDPVMSTRRLVWICVIAFNIAMTLTYVMSKTIIYYGSLATFGVGHLR